MTQLDAYGRDVSQLGICHRCSASIKYIFPFDGKTYGSTCIEVVSGIRPDSWTWIDGRPNLEATKETLTEKEARIADQIARQQALDEKREGIRQVNQKKFAELIEVLRVASRYKGDFCDNMARDIASDGYTNELYEGILSPYAYGIIREIWGKQTGGRMNSKAYEAAVAEFDEKFDEGDAE
jgi:hypothetical protein